MNHHTDTTNEKSPGAMNTEGLTTDTTNDLNFATAIRGHAVHHLKDGEFLVCKYGHTFHANDFAEFQAFARRLGVSQ